MCVCVFNTIRFHLQGVCVQVAGGGGGRTRARHCRRVALVCSLPSSQLKQSHSAAYTQKTQTSNGARARVTVLCSSNRPYRYPTGGRPGRTRRARGLVDMIMLCTSSFYAVRAVERVLARPGRKTNIIHVCAGVAPVRHM